MDQPTETDAAVAAQPGGGLGIDPEAVFEPHAKSVNPEGARPILQVDDLRKYLSSSPPG